MFYVYKNVKVFYNVFGDGDILVVLMHGWGVDSKSMFPLFNKLKSHNLNFRFLLIDFPPFGKSEEPVEPWVLNNYMQLTEILIEKEKNISKVFLIGHSFGGRVAIKVSAKQKIKINKLILLASAGIKPRISIKTKYKIFKYKILKKLKIKNNVLGSKDYRVLSPIMKKTFINIINEDLTNYCKTISCETLIVFGDKDTETPLYMGKILHKKIKNSELIIIKKGDHFAYINNLDPLFPIINSFLSIN